MAEVTVKQLAETVGISVDRLLRQMREAGLPHGVQNEAVNEDQKQLLLAYLKRSHGESDVQPKRITIVRKQVTTLKKAGTGGGKGRSVAVEVRKKRTYVKRDPVEDEKVAEGIVPVPEVAPVVIEPEPVVVEEVAPPVVEAVAPPAPEPEIAVQMTQIELERERSRKQDQARMDAQEAGARAEQQRQRDTEEKRREEALRVEAEAKAREDQRRKAELAKGRAPAEAAPARDKPAAAAADDRRGKTKERKREGGQDDEFGDGRAAHRRREIAMPKGRAGMRRRTKERGTTEQFARPTEFIVREIEVPEVLTVSELASRMSVKASEVIKRLMGMGVMATINQTLDQDTAVLIVEEFKHTAKTVSSNAIEHELQQSLDVEGESTPRPPVVTVMGHVDHGKTSLLDYIRKTRVAAGEAGGITQHIGAYHVETDRGGVTFIDTPGHAAFTAMRARGARVTDIVILVVAADDGVMPQTEEAIQHAKAAQVPIVVAVNKIDKEGVDADKVRNELAAKGVIPDAWGGDTQFVNVSAVTGQGIDELVEAIQLQAELLELSAVVDAPARGVVVESRLDRGRGPVATLLVKAGTLKRGDIVIAGQYVGRVRAMLDEQGKQPDSAGPSMPVEILGLSGTPDAGDEFAVVDDERKAREIADFRLTRSNELRVANHHAGKVENLFASMKAGEIPTLNILVKADVRGSLEALLHAASDMKSDAVQLVVVGTGVGGISESDATLAVASHASIFGFNVRADAAAKKIIEREGLDLRYYSVIYELLDDIKQLLTGLMAPEIREEIVGVAEVREVFRSPRFGQVAGCMVTEGTVHRNKKIRVLRDNVVIFQGELESLRRFKDDVGEVRSGFECGIGVRNYNDVKAGDKIEVFDVREIARSL